jgi:hypothetical protein
MLRASLCLAIVAAALWLAPDARAHGHSHHHDVHVHRSFFGFLDYRHSVDPWDDPSYRAYRSRLDHEREYVFHHMTGREAFQRWHGHDRGGATPVKRTIRYGGGDHHDAWGIHASDHHHHH